MAIYYGKNTYGLLNKHVRFKYNKLPDTENTLLSDFF